MLSWSSGQDVALSRRNQGFDSPREYQYKKEISENGISFLLLFSGGESDPTFANTLSYGFAYAVRFALRIILGSLGKNAKGPERP